VSGPMKAGLSIARTLSCDCPCLSYNNFELIDLPQIRQRKPTCERSMRQWLSNVSRAILTVGQGMYVTLWYFLQTYKRKAFTQHFEYPELPVPVKPRYRGFHRFDLTTCIGCDKCARACPVDCIYIEKIKNPVGKGFRVNGFKIDYTKCMFCA